MRARIFFIVLVFFWVPAHARPAPPKCFPQATAKWKAYLDRLALYQATVSESSFDLTAGEKLIEQGRLEFKQLGTSRLFLREGSVPRVYGTCWVVNPDYAFVLKKNSKGKWALSELDTEIANGVHDAYIKSQLIEQGVGINYAPFGTSSHGFFSNLFQDPRFTALSEVTDPTTGRMKIEFQIIHTAEEIAAPGPTLVDGKAWVVLDPQQYWRVCEYSLPLSHASGNSLCVGKIECDLADPNFPLVTRKINTYYKVGATAPYQRLVKEYKVEKRSPSESEFRVSAFGFPEPGIARKPGWWTSPHVWLSAVALISFAAVLGIRRYRNREARPA